MAQRPQHPGDVEALAAGAFGDLADPVAAVRDERVDGVRHVERGVQGDGQDHLVRSLPRSMLPAVRAG
ncbi:hypothetical protein P376_2852 [Streptomyces sp. HCCB10043]|nr:hypothetical protein P376_2852 [Streptomyces sp. HCCB10043]